MSELSRVKLSDVAKVSTGFAFKGNGYCDEGIRVVRGENVSLGELRWDTIKCWNQPFSQVEKYSLCDGDIVIGMDGSRVGRNRAQVKKSDLPLLLAQRVARVNAKEGYSQNLIAYIIKSSIFEQYVTRVHTGTSIPHISQKQIEEFSFDIITDYKTQTEIAEILSSLDDKIELNNKINQELETLAQTLFKQWFIDFEFPNENGEPYKSSGGEMVESELGMIPKGWGIVTIDDVTETVTKGTTPTTIGGRFTEQGINFIKVESLTESGAFIKSKFAHIDDETNLLLKRSIIKKGDVLFSIAGTIGRVAVVKEEILPANTNQAIAIIRPNKISSYFLKILMQSSLIQNDTQSNIVQAVQANLSLGVIKLTKFILPSNNILSKIDIQLNNIYDNINHLTNENENLTTLRDTLLPKLISGELEISEINN
jgi:type I restriction enzyme S subunit